jgi:phosphoglycolate phosphatase
MNRSTSSKIQCVIYDCDGVLFDSFEANQRLYNDLCASVGRSPLKEREMQYVHSHTVYEAIHYLFQGSEGLEKRALEQLKKIHLRDYIVQLKMEPHLLETLDRLKKKGIHRAINTNRTTSMPTIMEKFNLWPYFDMVVTALDVKHPKPHPESIDKIVKALDVNRDEILYVGDSDVDRQTASASGVRFVAYKNKGIAETILIQDHLELLAFVPNDEK